MKLDKFWDFYIFESIDYRLSVIQMVNGCIQGACDSASNWMDTGSSKVPLEQG